jgi:hypothetical protein
MVNAAQYGGTLRMLVRDSFKRCYVNLLGALWAELEMLLHALHDAAAGPAGAPAHRCVQLRAEALLLELALLRERCEALSACGLLLVLERRQVCLLLRRTTALLAFRPMNLPQPSAVAAIEAAQNLLFDELWAVASEAPRQEQERLAG